MLNDKNDFLDRPVTLETLTRASKNALRQKLSFVLQRRIKVPSVFVFQIVHHQKERVD